MAKLVEAGDDLPDLQAEKLDAIPYVGIGKQQQCRLPHPVAHIAQHNNVFVLGFRLAVDLKNIPSATFRLPGNVVPVQLLKRDVLVHNLLGGLITGAAGGKDSLDGVCHFCNAVQIRCPPHGGQHRCNRVASACASAHADARALRLRCGMPKVGKNVLHVGSWCKSLASDAGLGQSMASGRVVPNLAGKKDRYQVV